MSQEHSMNKATFGLKVGMHCNACRKKVHKLLHKIEGVDQVDINAEEKMVTVSGDVDPAILLKTLKKAGKRAELWDSEDGKNDDQLKDGKGPLEDNGKPQKETAMRDDEEMNIADEERDGDEEKDHNEEADDIHEDNEENQNQGDDIDGDNEDNQNQGDDIDDDGEDNQNPGGGGEGGAGNNIMAARPMFCPYMMAQGFQCMHLGRMGNMPHAPRSHMGNIPAGAVPPGYFHGGMAAPEMFAPPTNPYQQQYLAAMMEQHRMMMSGQAGGAANPPPPNGYRMPCTLRYVDQYTNMFSDENPNACSIM